MIKHFCEVPERAGVFNPNEWNLPKFIVNMGMRVASGEWIQEGDDGAVYHFQVGMDGDGVRYVFGLEAGIWKNVFLVCELPEEETSI